MKDLLQARFSGINFSQRHPLISFAHHVSDLLIILNLSEFLIKSRNKKN